MEPETICNGCGNAIDPEVCWCGSFEQDHNIWVDPHPFVPMGCDCYRATESYKPPGNPVVEDVLNGD